MKKKPLAAFSEIFSPTTDLANSFPTFHLKFPSLSLWADFCHSLMYTAIKQMKADQEHTVQL